MRYRCFFRSCFFLVAGSLLVQPLQAQSDDLCADAIATGLTVGAVHMEVMNITPAGDHDWRSFIVPGPDGWDMRIETISDQPGTNSDDTDLGLWSSCPEMGGTLIGFNDDKAGDFTSRINVGVLAPGTYYVEVGGFNDVSTPDDFTLEIEVTGTGPPGVIPEPASGLEVEVIETGHISVSADGVASNIPTGATIQVEKPVAGATVRRAYLACASNFFRRITDGNVSLDGSPIVWDKSVLNNAGIGSPSFFNNVFSEVTGIVKPKVDLAPAGLVDFTVVEDDTVVSINSIDGCALYTIFDDPSQMTINTVAILFGGQRPQGDDFLLSLDEPLIPTDTAQLGLAISFGFQGGPTLDSCGTVSPMFSLIDVNGSRLTSCAGNFDDGVESLDAPFGNGTLLTVGGVGDDPANPTDPFQEAADGAVVRILEDEFYDLAPFFGVGTTALVETLNPSDDDNIFAGHFFITADADVDRNPPLCSGTAGGTAGVLGSGSANDEQLGDIGITVVELEPGADNASLVILDPISAMMILPDRFEFDPPVPSVSYRVDEVVPALGGFATVRVEDGALRFCTNSYSVVPAGPVTDVILCVTEDLQFSASNETPTPEGPAVCDTNEFGEEPGEPPLPPGIVPSDAEDPNPCRTLTIDSPIDSGEVPDVTMVYKKDGPFDPRLRILFSKQDPLTSLFLPYEDKTASVTQVATILGEDPTRLTSVKVRWSPVKITCGIQPDCAVDALECSVGIGACAVFGTTGCHPLNPTETACLDGMNPVEPGPPDDEVCDQIDNNCNGQIDEGFDVDGDGFTQCDVPQPDCNDGDATINPDTVWYPDVDGDLFGDPGGVTLTQCAMPAGHVTDNTDCNDGDATINPGALDVCNGIDDDCDGEIDDEDEDCVPNCSGTPSTVPGVLGDGTATDVGFMSGIVSVALDPLSQNAQLTSVSPVPSPSEPAGTVTFRLDEIIQGLGGFGTVVATDGADQECRVSFSSVPAGPVEDQVVCAGGGLVLSATNETATDPGNASCGTTPIEEGDLPTGIVPSPPNDPNPCRVLTITSPIDSPAAGPDVTMTLKKDGPFDPRLRILVAEQDPMTGQFGSFTDVTSSVTEIPTLTPDPTRLTSVKVRWSDVQVTCGILDDCNAILTPCSVGAGACAVFGTTGCDPLNPTETACLDGMNNPVVPEMPGTETCDGVVDDDCDGIVDNATITVGAVEHTVGAGSHPGSTKEPIIGLEVSLYDKSVDSCARDVCDQGISWQCYDMIFDVCAPVVVNGQMARGLTDANGEILFDLPPGDYLVIGGDGTDKHLGVSASALACGDQMQKHLQRLIKADGKKVAGKRTKISGSELWIIEPEYIEWTGTEELYPIVLESAESWDVVSAVTPPEGFIADYATLSENVDHEVEALQFTITDVGSEWVPTTMEHYLVHNGRHQRVISRIGVKLSAELAQAKNLDRFGHPLGVDGLPLPAQGPDQRDRPTVEVLGWIEPSGVDPDWTIKIRVNVPGWVVLEVADPSGAVRRSLFQGDLKVGEHKFQWDGLDSAGNEVRARTDLLLRTDDKAVQTFWITGRAGTRGSASGAVQPPAGRPTKQSRGSRHPRD